MSQWVIKDLSLKDPASAVKVFMSQLEALRSKAKDIPLLEKDLAGYRELLAHIPTDSKLLERFMEMKWDAIFADKKYANNLEVIEEMKRTGMWVKN